MANQLQVAGSQSEKPSKYAPLHVAQMFTGYWPNSSPVRDAAVPFLYQKFYSASRNDKIVAGLNAEISPRMTLVRRPGHSVYNSQNFSNLQEFFSFKPFEPGVGEQVIVIADTTTNVYNATGPSTKTSLFSKSTTAKSRFKGVENTLFWGDGVSLEKWSWFVPWAATTTYSKGTCVLDSSNNIQQSIGYALAISSTALSPSDVLTVNYAGAGTVTVGEQITLYGLTTKTLLNGVVVTVASQSSGTFTATGFTGSSYSTTSDTGVAYDPLRSGVSGGSTPSFSGTIGTAVIDGTTAWLCKGSSVQNFGIAAPTVAPTCVNVAITPANQWAANTYYWPSPLILDSNNNIQQLTTSGTTGGSVPAWANTVGATTTDGSAVWTCLGAAVRNTGTAYSVGAIVEVTWSFSYQYDCGNTGPPNYAPILCWKTLTYTAFFQCTTSGTTSAASASTIWNTPAPAYPGSTVMDGTVVWTNVGSEVTRTNAATSSPVIGTSAGNVSNSVVVSTNTSIVDSNSNLETCVFAGISAGSAPTWSKVLGTVITESGGLQWKESGPSGAANTAAWVYAYSWANSSTGDESTASPLSTPIVLAANSAISVSGPGSTDTQVDTVKIYRSVLGQATPFFLAEIAAPLGGQSWQFTDTTPDPPNPGATLDVLITAAGYAVVNGVVTNFNDPPPAGLTNLEFHAGRMWGTVGNIVYFSTGPDVTVGNGTTAWDVLNFFEVPGTVFRLWPTTVGLYIFTNDGLWIITGLGTSTSPFSTAQLVDPDISIASYDAFTTNGAQANIYTTDRSFLLIDAQNGTSNVGFPVQTDLVTSYNPASVYVTWYSNGLDQKGFITNGSNSWLNYMPTPPPETGYLWNPPATVVSSPGIVAVQSIETSPGLFNLLLGPSTSGPILKRDTSVFTDNASSYNSFTIIGSVVLAHHGQMAGVAFIGLDAIRTGTQPGVSVLFDEFQGMAGSPSFTAITSPVNDPPNFPASATIFNSRYWVIQSGTVCYCRHMQLEFSFGTDTVQNELLSFTIYGTSITEE